MSIYFRPSLPAAAGSAAAPSIAFIGDPNTGVYSPGADQVAISTNGTGRLFVDASGNIGASVTPSAWNASWKVLEFANGHAFGSSGVQSAIAQNLFNNSGGSWVYKTSAPATFYQQNNGEYIWYTAASGTAGNTASLSERMRLDSSGRLGLGSSVPDALLTVNGVGAFGAGAVTTPSIAATGDLNTGFWFPAADTVALSTGGSERIRVDSSGNVAVDTNTLYVDAVNNRVAIGTTSPTQNLEVFGATTSAIRISGGSGGSDVNRRATLELLASGSKLYKITASAADGSLQFLDDTTERFRCDSSGRLLVGTSTARGNFFNSTGSETNLQLEGTTFAGSSSSFIRNSNNDSAPFLVFGKSRGTSVGSNTVVFAEDNAGAISFQAADGTDMVPCARIDAYVDGTPGANDMPGRLVFSTTKDGSASPTQRMRISNLGTHFIVSEQNGVVTSTTLAAGTSDYLYLGYSAGIAGEIQSGTFRFGVFTNGNVVNSNNSYGAISDIKLKENIVNANSQWDDLKALQVRNYNFKEGQTHTQIGLVAQEVELVSPGLVSESPDRDAEGNDLGTVTKSVNYSVLYMKAVKALQEAMERIETLEAKVAALEGA